ncbi:MAG: hypothetical protein B7Y70_01490, partial [Rhizobiales bacterium 35-68-8]
MRLQFHADFPLDAALPLIPYFADLGISHVYSSPLLTSRPGSSHGYDTVDHGTLDPEAGGEVALRRLVAELRTHGMGLILDIVPNHMGVGGADNRVWLDVLEWGRESDDADVFDIDWAPPDAALAGKVLVPVLGAPYGEALKSGTVTLAYDAARGEFQARHYGHVFPICPRHYGLLLAGAADEALAGLGIDCSDLPAGREGKAAAIACKERLAMFVAENGPENLSPVLAAFDATDPEGCRRLHDLLERQNFRLAWWRTANDDLNWRRFFDITELAGVQVERQDVFERSHALLFRLYAEGIVDGFRVDHVDGISDPAGYCRRLRRRLEQLDARRPPEAPEGGYLVVEKILHRGEKLPESWPVDGTTGYDFAAACGGLFVDAAAEEPFTHLYQNFIHTHPDFNEMVRANKHLIMEISLAGELQVLATQLTRLAKGDRRTCDFTFNSLRGAL